MEIKYLWRPIWFYDEVDKKWVPHGLNKVLHYRESRREIWEPVDIEEYPNEAQQQELLKMFPHPSRRDQ